MTYKLNTRTLTYLDEFEQYRYMIPWLKSLKLYQLIKDQKIDKIELLQNMSNVEYTWALVMVCFRGTRVLHRRFKHRAWYSKRLQKHLRNRNILHVRQLRKYCYTDHGNGTYTFFTMEGGKFGPDIGYLVCRKAFKAVRKLAGIITIAQYPVISNNGGYLHVYLYRKFVGPTLDVVDHINGRRNDVRLINLRTCTFKHNTQNKALRQSGDFFIGIFRVADRWGTKLSHTTFATAVEAAKYYDFHAVKRKTHVRTNAGLGYI